MKVRGTVTVSINKSSVHRDPLISIKTYVNRKDFTHNIRHFYGQCNILYCLSIVLSIMNQLRLIYIKRSNNSIIMWSVVTSENVKWFKKVSATK